MIETDEKYTLAQGPSDMALTNCHREWAESNATISFVTRDDHFVVKVTSISKPHHEEEPWFIAGKLPNNQAIYINYYTGGEGEDGGPVCGIAYFWSDPNNL